MPKNTVIKFEEINSNQDLLNELEDGSRLFIDGLSFEQFYHSANASYATLQKSEAINNRINLTDDQVKKYTKQEVLEIALAHERRVVYYPIDQKSGKVLSEPVEVTLEKGYKADEPMKEKGKNIRLKFANTPEDIQRYISAEKEGLKFKNRITAIQNSSHYKKIEEYNKNTWEVLGPLGKALYGDAAAQEYSNDDSMFGMIGEKSDGVVDFSRGGVLYGLAYMISLGYKIEDIFDPEKLIEEKRKAGDELRELQNNRSEENDAKILNAFMDATEKMLEMLPNTVEDNLLDNLKDVKLMIICRTIFDINQRMGIFKNACHKALEDKYKDKENYKDLAKAHFDRAYDAVGYIQELYGPVDAALRILTVEPALVEAYIKGYLFNLQVWNGLKDDYKNILKNKGKTTVEEFNSLKEKSNDLTLDAMTQGSKVSINYLDALPAMDLIENNVNEFAKVYLGDVLKETFGAEKVGYMDPAHRIFINGEPLSVLFKDRNPADEDYYDKLAMYIAEAYGAGLNVSVYTMDPETKVTDRDPIILKFPYGIKELLEHHAPKTFISQMNPLEQELFLGKEAEYINSLNTTGYIDKLKNVETLQKESVYSMLPTIIYNTNASSAMVANALFGEGIAKKYAMGEPIDMIGTTMDDIGTFHFGRAGIALGVASLLADGMTLEQILDPTYGTEQKQKVIDDMKTLANKGDEGRREMAFKVEKAMEILSEGKYINNSPNLLESMSDFRSVFVTQLMIGLSKELEADNLNLYEAHQNRIKTENSKLDVDAVNTQAISAYNKTQNIANAYKGVKLLNSFAEDLQNNISEKEDLSLGAAKYLGKMHEYQMYHSSIHNNLYSGNHQISQKTDKLASHSNSHIIFEKIAKGAGKTADQLLIEIGGLSADFEKNVSIDFQYQALKHLSEDLQAADKGVFNGSNQYKGMMLVVEDILKHYESDVDKTTPAWNNALEKKMQQLAYLNDEYLAMKEGKTMKAGSNGERRLAMANRVKDLVSANRELIQQRSEYYLGEQFDYVNENMADIDKENQNYDIVFKHVFNPKKAAIKDQLDRVPSKFVNEINTARNEANDITELAGFTEEQVALFTLLGAGTLDASQSLRGTVAEGGNEKTDIINTDEDLNIVTTLRTSNIIEDMYKMRDGSGKKQMPFIEQSRANIKNALEAYNQGDKTILGGILAEGLTNYKCTFWSFPDSFGVKADSGSVLAALRKAAQIYDMLSSNKELLAAVTDKKLGDKALSPETLKSYRAAKGTCQVLENGIEAKKYLMNVDFKNANNPKEQKKIKQALADLVLKNMLHAELARNKEAKFNSFDPTNVKGTNPFFNGLAMAADSFQLEMGETQLKLTPEKVNAYREKLMKSKMLDSLSKNMTKSKLVEILDKEHEGFLSLANRMKETESSVFKDKEVKFDEVVNKAQNEQVLNM